MFDNNILFIPNLLIIQNQIFLFFIVNRIKLSWNVWHMVDQFLYKFLPFRFNSTYTVCYSYRISTHFPFNIKFNIYRYIFFLWKFDIILNRNFSQQIFHARYSTVILLKKIHVIYINAISFFFDGWNKYNVGKKLLIEGSTVLNFNVQCCTYLINNASYNDEISLRESFHLSRNKLMYY